MKVVLFLSLALVATAFALPLCTGPECQALEKSTANNMTTIVIHLGKDTDFILTVPDHISKLQERWYLMVSKAAIDRAWARGFITRAERDQKLEEIKKALDKITDKTNNDLIVAESLYEVHHRRDSGVNVDIVIELTNTSKIVIHVPDHLSKGAADMIFEMGKEMIEAELARGVITEEVADAAMKKLRTELDKLVTKLTISNGLVEIDIDVTEDIHIHLNVPDSLSKMQANQIYEMVKQMIEHEEVTKEQEEAALKKLKEELDKLITHAEGVENLEDYLSIRISVNGGVLDDEVILTNIFEDAWKKLIDWLNTKGHGGVIAAKLLNKYRGKIDAMLKKILKDEAKELIELIEKVKDDIIKIIKGGHIDVMNDEEMLDSPFDDMWKRIIDWLSSKGHVGQIAAKLLEKYKEKVETMLKKILKEEAQELIKLIDDIKADLIKIIKGGHIDVLMNDEEMLGNPFDDLWKRIIDWLSSRGHAGQIAAKLLEKYKEKIEAMLKKILKEEAQELIKLIDDIKADIIKIIKGGHIDVFMNDEEMLGNPIDDLWNKMIDWLNGKGHAGIIAAKLLNKYKGKVEAMLTKILKAEAEDLIHLIELIRDDVITIIKGGHIDPKNRLRLLM